MSIAYGDALFLDEAKLFEGATKAEWNQGIKKNKTIEKNKNIKKGK